MLACFSSLQGPMWALKGLVPWSWGPRDFSSISPCYWNTPQVLSVIFRAWIELPLLSQSSKGWAATAQYRILVNAKLGGNNSCDIVCVTKNACCNQRKSRPGKCSYLVFWGRGGCILNQDVCLFLYPKWTLKIESQTVKAVCFAACCGQQSI